MEMQAEVGAHLFVELRDVGLGTLLHRHFRELLGGSSVVD